MSGVRLFLWVRLRTWQASLEALVRAPVKLSVMVLAWTVLLGGLAALSYRGLQFINETTGVGPFLLTRLWFLFLFVIMILLAISQVSNAYSTLVRSPETQWWMTLPVSARTLARAKWLESSLYSTWAVVAFALPMTLAYLMVLKKPLWLLGWSVGALLIPLTGIVTVLATLALLLWLRWAGRIVLRREVIAVGFAIACGAVFWVLGERAQEEQQDVWFLALQELLPRMRVAMSLWWPSSWAATAFDAWLHDRWTEGLLYAGLLWTTWLLTWRALDHVAAGVLGAVLRRHATLAPSAGIGRAPLRHSQFRMPWWTRHPFVASLAKDVLLVARDPMQWCQAVMFFGLLGAYFANIDRLSSFSGEPFWRIGIASLNLAATLLVFGSLAVRFIFPQMSLEGRSLWLLRVAPHGMRRLVQSKLCLYSALAVSVIEGLLLLSSSRLGVSAPVRWWLASLGLLASLAIVGLTVGLGAWWINPDAQDAARVVSSSSGALVLVLMLGYVGAIIAALVMGWTGWAGGHRMWLALASLWCAAVSLAVSIVPVRMGLKKLERSEWT